MLQQFADRLSARNLKASEPGTVRLHRHRIYIVPTLHGLYFGLALFVMLLSAINYSNSLAFMLTFLLGSMFILSMIKTHHNLLGLNLRCGISQPVFAGQTALLKINIHNPGKRERYDIFANDDTILPILEANASDTIQIPVTTTRRGHLSPGRIRIATRYPLNLTRAWSWWQPDYTLTVYPKPETNAPPVKLRGQSGTGERTRTTPAQGDEFVGLRNYAAGDPLSRLTWRRQNAEGLPCLKQFHEQIDSGLWLSWDSVSNLGNIEQRLSRLCQWVLECDARHEPYGLSLPNQLIEPASGSAHLHQCLTALALFQMPRVQKV
ncbi:MAG TPA: DUF58 domain-containing protein [Gammaproteobacteria bacterium]|nr:DUF58 domain-containing protein [Gammaproteobacteria bacterium]